MSESSRGGDGKGDTARPSLFDRLRGVFGLGGASIRDDIQDALEDSLATKDFSPQERTMLQNVLRLRELRVDDVMVPRADIVAVNVDATLLDMLALFRTAGHSRLPVHGETLDDPRGMIHIRDFLDYLASNAERRPRRRKADPQSPEVRPPPRGFGAIEWTRTLAGTRIIRPVLFVPPSMPALDLLLKMQTARTHMALVIDEYGGTDGLVSIEDLVETIVGDIEDEHDESDAPSLVRAADGSFLVDARASLEDIAKAFDIPLDAFTDAEEIDTMGGLVTTLAGRVPVRGEVIAGPQGLEFEVLDADPRRVKRLRLRRDVPAAPVAPASRRAARAAEKELLVDSREAQPRPSLPAPAAIKALPAPDVEQIQNGGKDEQTQDGQREDETESARSGKSRGVSGR